MEIVHCLVSFITFSLKFLLFHKPELLFRVLHGANVTPSKDVETWLIRIVLAPYVHTRDVLRVCKCLKTSFSVTFTYNFDETK